MKPLNEQCSEHQKKSAGEMPSEETRTAPGNAAPTREVLQIHTNTYFKLENVMFGCYLSFERNVDSFEHCWLAGLSR